MITKEVYKDNSNNTPFIISFNLKTLFNTDLYRCVFLFFATIWLTLGLGISAPPWKNVDVYLLIWGYSILIWDIILEKKLFHTKFMWLIICIITLFFFGLCYNYAYFDSNIQIFLLSIIYMLVLLPVNTQIKTTNRYKIIFLFCMIFIIPVTITSMMSLWTFFNDSSIANRSFSSFRLRGYYATVNRAGHASMLSIAMLLIILSMLKQIFSSKKTIVLSKTISIALILIHLIALFLSGTRATILCLIVFLFMYTFFALFRLFTIKKTHIIIKIFLSVFIAAAISGTIYYAEVPIRYGAAIINATMTRKNNNDTTNTNKAYPQSDIFLSTIRTPILNNIIEKEEAIVLHENDSDTLKISVSRRIEFLDSNGRYPLWQIAFKLIQRHPILGMGYGGILDEAIELYKDQPDMKKIARPSHIYTNFAAEHGIHNAYIQLAATNGVPSLILLLLFFMFSGVYYAKKLFICVQSEKFLPAGALLALFLAFLVYFVSESYLFLTSMKYCAVIFWSCLSFAGSLLEASEETAKNIEQNC